MRQVCDVDGGVQHCAYNINYLYPSGGSLPHPHAQIFVDPYPTTMMRLQYRASERYWSEHGRSFWEALIEAEERRGERFVGRIGATSWITAFAPLGFNEVRAVVSGRETFLDLTDEDAEALALGVSRVLSWYEASGYNSFNLAFYSGPLSGAHYFRPNLIMVTRSALVPNYRSDAMHLERLHWEAAVDRPPEALAAELRGHFLEGLRPVCGGRSCLSPQRTAGADHALLPSASAAALRHGSACAIFSSVRLMGMECPLNRCKADDSPTCLVPPDRPGEKEHRQ